MKKGHVQPGMCPFCVAIGKIFTFDNLAKFKQETKQGGLHDGPYTFGDR